MAMEFVKGVYFNPKDADLLHLLRLKVSGQDVIPQQYGLIWDREVYQDEMPCDFFVGDFAHHPELYFFTTLKSKFQNGNADRKDRAVGNGYWRTQRTVKVPDPDSDDHNSFLGFRTMLNFFEYGTKTGSKWIMHEYTLPPAAKQQGLAVCRIKRSSRNPKSTDSSSPASSSSSGPVKRKATPLDHHKKRPHFSHPQSQVAPTITQSPLTPPHISASPLDDDDHSDHTVSHDTPEAAAAATPDDDDADYVRLLENELTKEDDFLDSDVAALHPEKEVIIIEDDLDSNASALHPDIAASPLDDDHSKRVCHHTPEATPDDDDAEYVHFPENELIIIEDDLDSDASALHPDIAASPLDDDHSKRVCHDTPAAATTTHAAAILDPLGETEHLLAELPNYNFCSDQQNPKQNSTSAADSDDEGSGKRPFLSTTNDGEREPMGWNERVQQ